MSAVASVPDARPLAGRVVLVVGAHGGLGRALALACARAGATQVLLGRSARKLERVADAVEQAGGEALLYPLDLEGATPDDYAELATRIAGRFGRLDGVVHCAADFPGLTPLEHVDPAVFARTVHVGLTARWWLSQACLPLLHKSDAGRLVFLVDPAPAAAPAYWGGYGIVQPALDALAATLEAETASSPLRVQVLRPGPLRTPLRARAYAADDDRLARDAATAAAACVALLAAEPTAMQAAP
ncbi:SDR family NAD(P)-dependent oxidoreductase [Luteimonas kalidii]|uniref:SDR family NAD(P)-dependent oxidoreductase n=1 Tax=Luteimonas kalidii TaxID=3042025 RepID=A0ABT6JXV7_9GAMM|nr:SDR family NAD(P)-dependent oxidoreductase [Luteimonas kalidii]MDH5835540.1 SDR family NAD(P)-dependent oxidoreductase [Luteimonas kalidii]